MDNIFFDIDRLKNIGKNVIIGKTARIRYPELVSIGDNVIIDDFCYISTNLTIKSYVHISSGCKIIGGQKSNVVFNDFSTLSPNVVIAAGSDDYISGIATPLVSEKYKGNVQASEIIIGRHSIIGSNSVILPGVSIGEGASLGALSLANKDLKEWYLHVGIPAKKIKKRMKNEILKSEANFYNNE
jgi:acetyltransferase-like isoleucine patch superfamily enzyme